MWDCGTLSWIKFDTRCVLGYMFAEEACWTWPMVGGCVACRLGGVCRHLPPLMQERRFLRTGFSHLSYWGVLSLSCWTVLSGLSQFPSFNSCEYSCQSPREPWRSRHSENSAPHSGLGDQGGAQLYSWTWCMCCYSSQGMTTRGRRWGKSPGPLNLQDLQVQKFCHWGIKNLLAGQWRMSVVPAATEESLEVSGQTSLHKWAAG